MKQDIQEYLSEKLSLLPSDKVLSQAEAQKRASTFLSVLAVIAEEKHTLSKDKVKLQSLFSIANNQALSSAEGSTVGARTAYAESTPSYIQTREEVENAENNIRYLMTMYEIFLNAHLLLRNMSKESM